MLLANSVWAETAFTALKALPKADARKLVWMEAKGGPGGEPEQWRFTVYDAKASKRLREFIVAAGEVVTSQEVAEASPGVSAKNVVDPASLKIDSDAAARTALDYASTHGFQVASVTYELQKQGAKAVPLWAVTCLDGSGAQMGAVALTATRGSVVAQEGFSAATPAAAVAGASGTQAAPEAPTGERVDRRVVSSDQQFLTELDGASAPVASQPSAGAPGNKEPAPPRPEESEQPAADLPPADEGSTAPPQRVARAESTGDEIDGQRTFAGEGRSHAPSGRVERIHGPRVISPIREVRRATAPVRHIIRRVLPF